MSTATTTHPYTDVDSYYATHRADYYRTMAIVAMHYAQVVDSAHWDDPEAWETALDGALHLVHTPIEHTRLRDYWYWEMGI